jgi:phospholipid-translocating ATPase
MLYRETQKGMDMSVAAFAECVLRGMLQSVAGFWITLSATKAPGSDGSTSSHDIDFVTAYTGLMILQVLTVICESRSLTWLNLVAIGFMPLCYLAMTWIYATIPRLQFFGVFQRTLDSQLVLVSMALAVGLFLPRLIVVVVQTTWRPSAKEVMRNDEIWRQHRSLRHLFRLSGALSRWRLRRWASYMAGSIRMLLTPEAPSRELPRTTHASP